MAKLILIQRVPVLANAITEYTAEWHRRGPP